MAPYNMDDNRQWVALLTEDEDDFAYWQFGFGCWADHMRIEWFATGEAFFIRPGLLNRKPAVLLLDGLIPSDEEQNWLGRILEHECCQTTVVIMLSDHFLDDQKEVYLNMGAKECMIKPTNQHELEEAICRISKHAAG